MSEVLEQLNKANLIPAGEKQHASTGYQFSDQPHQDTHSPLKGQATSRPHASDIPLTVNDPLVYLRRDSKTVVALEIVDFVNVAPPTMSVQASSSTSVADLLESLVQLKTGPRRPRIEDVSVADWSVANTRIMDKLFGDNVTEEVRDYWSYTVKISELFRDFERVSVLLFDKEYRHLQAEKGFRWGTDIPHLHTLRLLCKPPQPIA